MAVALIPAAGFGTRLGLLPCSKELVPVGGRPVGAYLMDHFAAAGLQRAHWLIRREKQDIVRAFGATHDGLPLAYHALDATPGTPYSLNAAYPFVRGEVCALGFPDILLPQDDAFAHLLEYRDRAQCDVVLGLYPTAQPQLVDVVRAGADDGVEEILIKPQASVQDPLTWSVAVWGPSFTEFLHERLGSDEAVGREMYVGDVFLAAMAAGLSVRAIQVSDAPSVDVGTAAGLAHARIIAEG